MSRNIVLLVQEGGSRLPATPRRAGQRPRHGSRFLSEILAENVRAIRALQRLNQTDLAERMTHLGADWSRATVSEVEQAGRTVNVEELAQLAVALDVTIGELLDPTGPGHHRKDNVDLGVRDRSDEDGDGPLWVLPAWWAHAWLRDRLVVGGFSGRMFNLRLRVAPDLQPQAQREVDRIALFSEAQPWDPAWQQWASDEERKARS